MLAEIVSGLLRQFKDARRVDQLVAGADSRNKDLERKEALLSHYRRIFDRASELAKIGAWETDFSSGEVIWTEGAYDIYGLPKGHRIDPEHVYRSFCPLDQAALRSYRRAAQETGEGFTHEAEITTAGGHKRWVRLTADVECKDGVPARLIGMAQDITTEKAALDRIRVLAERDLLTGLPNRGLLISRLERELTIAERCLLLIIDINGFKHINENFGHAIGDECLKQIAMRLRRLCTGAMLLARLGGDEFAILIPCDATSRHDEFAQRVLDQFQRPVIVGERGFQVAGSIGIAIGGEHGVRDAAELMIAADLALRNAKVLGRNTISVFTPRMRQLEAERFGVIRDVGEALSKGQLELFYQPKFRLADEKLTGFEALLRWRRPDGQIVAAGAFSAALADPALSARIGQWVLDAALAQASAWHDQGIEFHHIAVNLSASQFYEDHFAARLIRRIADCGLQASMIEIEVTESVFLSQEPGAVQYTLDELAKGGVRISLDDFGTGFASLIHLRTYPVNAIKIDKSFVQLALDLPQDKAILSSALFLAHSLGLDAVAEGIETREQLEMLKAERCSFGQGYLFSKPVPASEISTFAKSRPGRPKRTGVKHPRALRLAPALA